MVQSEDRADTRTNPTDLLGRLLGGPLGHLLDQSERGPRFLVAQVYRTAVEIVYNLRTGSTGGRERSARLTTCDHTMIQRQATRFPVWCSDSIRKMVP